MMLLIQVSKIKVGMTVAVSEAVRGEVQSHNLQDGSRDVYDVLIDGRQVSLPASALVEIEVVASMPAVVPSKPARRA